jgi:hypothetical protein
MDMSFEKTIKGILNHDMFKAEKETKNSEFAETVKHYDVASLYPEYPTIEKIEFPIENVKEIVEQIIILNREINSGHYSEEIARTIEILNDSLKRLLNPSFILGGLKNEKI